MFIECTATDLTRAQIVVNSVIAHFSEYCADKFTFEEVQVVYEEEKLTRITPTDIERKVLCDLDYLNTLAGI